MRYEGEGRQGGREGERLRASQLKVLTSIMSHLPQHGAFLCLEVVK